MSLFDWLFRRKRKPESKPLPPPVPPPPPTSAAPATATPSRQQGADAPRSPEATGTDPYGTEFLPVTRAEIVEAASKGNLLSTAFTFGRQSIIPPVTDQRTQLIDRALV